MLRTYLIRKIYKNLNIFNCYSKCLKYGKQLYNARVELKIFDMVSQFLIRLHLQTILFEFSFLNIF